MPAAHGKMTLGPSGRFNLGVILLSVDMGHGVQIAERTIHDDMEFLIKQTVDPRKADYAVISGIQIHSWGEKFDDEAPNLEFIAPCSVYCVVAGERTYLDLFTIPGLTPRQISVLSSAGASDRAKRADPDEVLPLPLPSLHALCSAYLPQESGEFASTCAHIHWSIQRGGSFEVVTVHTSQSCSAPPQLHSRR